MIITKDRFFSFEARNPKSASLSGLKTAMILELLDHELLDHTIFMKRISETS